MKSILIINQRAVIESGIKGLDAVDLLLFDCLAQEISRGSGERLLIGNVFWRHVSYSAMQKLLPLVNLSKQSFYRRLNRLVKARLIEKSSSNESLGMVLICLADKADSILNPTFISREVR